MNHTGKGSINDQTHRSFHRTSIKPISTFDAIFKHQEIPVVCKLRGEYVPSSQKLKRSYQATAAAPRTDNGNEPLKQ